MGYFNIFYKITRIIDMLTRKRNRKAIMVILIIVAVVFIYHNKVNAQEDDLTYNQSFYTLRMRVSSNGVVQSGTITTSSSTTYHHCIVIPVKEGFVYKGKCTTAFPSSSPGLYVTFCSDLDEFQAQLDSHIVSEVNSGYFSSTALSYIGLYNATNGFEITAINDGFLIIGDFVDSNSYSLNNYGFTCVTNYNGESNLNTINQDLLRIETLLKDYLYGDRELYDVTYSSVSGLFLQTSSQPEDYKKFTSVGNYVVTYYFKVRNNVNYTIKVKSIDNIYQRFYCKRGYTNFVPALNTTVETFNEWENIDDTTYTFTGDSTYKYYFITIYSNHMQLDSIQCNYNEGQENGLYGGLTDINNQTRQQGEQTRETITNTDIPTNEMTIDTSIVDGVSNTDNDNFLTSIINRFQGVISPSATVTTITIPIPKTGKNIVLRSDLLSRHVANTVIGTYITVFWYVVFFIYFFKFAYRVINWIITGEIIEKPSAFMKYLMDQNAIITASMM